MKIKELENVLFERLVEKYCESLKQLQAQGVASDIWNAIAASTKQNYARSFKKWLNYTFEKEIEVTSPTTEEIMGFVDQIKGT